MHLLGRFRVGTKLLINAGFAIILVLGMSAYVLSSLGDMQAESAAVSRSVRALNHVLHAENQYLSYVILNRDIRMAQTEQAVRDAVAAQSSAAEHIRQELEGAAANVALPANRDRARRLQSIMNEYITHANRTGELRIEHLRARQQVIERGPDLARRLGDVVTARDFADTPSEDAVRGSVRDALTASYDARLGAIGYFATLDDAQRTRSAEALRRAEQSIRAALGQLPAQDSGREIIAPATAALQQYRATVDRALAPLAEMRTVEVEQTRPRRAQMMEIFEALRTSVVSRSEADQTAERQAQDAIRTVTLVVGGIVVLMLVLGAWLLSRAIATPLRGLTGQMGEIAGGKLDHKVEYMDRGDEVGDMARALEVFRENGLRVQTLEAEAATNRKAAEEARRAAAHGAARDLENSMGGVAAGLASTATELSASADSLGHTAEQALERAAAVTTGAQGASANVQSVAAAAEELAASIREITQQVTHAAQVARHAAEEAHKTDDTMRSLTEGAQRIGDVVQLIGNIAGQTNLLALNATIEAARAGDAGKGFAVVASEVKSLAAQTTRSTEEISRHVSDMQTVTNQAVNAIRSIGAVIAEVDNISTSIAAAVEEQQAVTQEIARSVAQAASGTSEVTTSIEAVRQAAGETSAAVTQLRAVTGDLARQGETLNGALRTAVDALRRA